jgi:hypothetical protein
VLILDPGTRRGLMGSAILWLLYFLRKRPGKDWAGFGGWSELIQKIISLGFKPQTVQPIVSHNTIYAV